MFKFLKNKIGNWAKKISEESEEETPKGKIQETKKKKPSKNFKKDSKKKLKNIPIPLKFNEGMQNYEPDTQKLKELKEKISEKEDPPKPGEKGFFKKITSKIKKIKISEEMFNIYAEELEMLLLENNVAFEVTEKIIKELKEEIVGKELLKKEIEEEIKDSLKNIIEKILIEPFNLPEKILEKKDSPYIILFCGINGTGKTTSIAKIAELLKKENITSVLAAGDTFRAASIEQLKIHGEKLGIKVISQNYGSDPAAVGFDAIKYAKKNKIQTVLIDTAGRMHTSKNLMKEIEKISKVCNPDTKIFVGESITGNDAIEQAKGFNWSIGIDGIILSKADIDEKGGTALSVGYVTKKPILYLGIGQEYDAIEPFNKQKFLKRLGL